MKDKLKLLLGVIVLVTALALCGVYLLGSNAENRLVMALVKAEKQLAEEGVLDLSDAEKIVAGVDENKAAVILGYASASDEGKRVPVLTAVLAAQMAWDGKLSGECAHLIVSDVLAQMPISSQWEKPLQDALPELLACLSPEELATVLTAADIASSDTALQDRLGDLAKGRLSLPQLAEVYRDRLAAKKPADRLAMRALSGRTQEAVVAALAAETDMERRAALARAYGKTLSLPDDVLTYLAEARAVGVSAVECYPTGAQVTWDLSSLAPIGIPRRVSGEAPRYLVVRMIEKAEAFEYRDVPVGVGMDEWYYDGAFTLVYESNDGHWMEAVTVRIDTEAMDLIPTEFLPTAVAEIDALVVLDTQYQANGTLRVMIYNSKNSQNVAVSSYRDYRTYKVVQRLDVYSAKNQRWIYTFDSQTTENSGLEKNSDGYNRMPSDQEMQAACIPVPDYVWMQERRTWLLDGLQECGGDLWQAIELLD